MSRWSRRAFLGQSLLASSAALLSRDAVARADEESPVKKAGANDRVNVAVIGYRGRGKKDPFSGRGGSHVSGFLQSDKNPDSAVVAICDVDDSLSEEAVRQIEEKQRIRPIFEQDFRRILDDKNVDAVSIATPNHWHALAAILAIQAGKDVYVEKPVSHNVWEGRRIVDAARHYGKIVQTGTQSRSAAGTRAFMDYLHEGKIGKLKLARALCYKRRGSIGPRHETQPPASVNFDLWCGPAAKLPVMRPSFHYDWHWTWEYGNGDLGNQGIHEMDRARWGLNKNALCNAVFSLGGRVGYEDAGETANTQLCFYDYGDCQIIFEVRGLPTKDLKGAIVGVIYYGTDGYAVSYSYSHCAVFTPDGEKVKEFKGGENHFANFIKAVKSRKHTDLNADIEEGHLSSALCHLGNVSYRLGSPCPLADEKAWNDLLESLDADGKDSVARMLLHLHANRVESPALTVGKRLKFDPVAEKFLDDSQANAMLSREYRKGFEVPTTF